MRYIELSKVNKRLTPLYVALFFSGLVFWYSIEKVFMEQIGFSGGQIAYAAALATIVTLLAETPLGILADRWSRKGVLIIMLIFLALSTLAFGLANSVIGYLPGIILYGIVVALESGNNEAIIYDTLLEETGRRDGFEEVAGRVQLIQGISLVAGAFAGGAVAAAFEPRLAFFISIPSFIVGVIFALKLKEPRLHKLAENPRFLTHFREVLKALKRSTRTKWIVLANVSALGLAYFYYEVDQLWPLALAMPLIWYGPLNALLLGLSGAAGFLAPKIKQREYLIAAAIIGLTALCVLSIRSLPIIVIALTSVVLIYSAFAIVANGLMQDELTSSLRTGVVSAINTISIILFIPTALLFGFVVDKTSIFEASYLLVPFGLAALISAYKSTRPGY